jgi:Family of unknown function (DUF5317)
VGLVAVSLVAALGVGALLGGSLRRLGTRRFGGWPLLLGALAVQLAGYLAGGASYTGSLIVSAALTLAFLALNRRLPGVALVSVGLLLNAVVVAANGAMPVSRPAAVAAGVSVSTVADGTDPHHEISGAGTRLHLLGDVVAVPLPGRPEVASPGDVAVSLGLALMVVAGMRRAPVRYQPGLTQRRTGS